MTGRGRRGARALGAGIGIAFALALAPAAHAARLDDGAGRLMFDKTTFAALEDADIVVTTLIPASAGKLRATFPVTGGDVNPVTGQGEIAHRGVLVLRVKGTGRVVELQQLRADVRPGGSLSARIGDRRIRIGRLLGRLLTDHDSDFVRTGGLRVELTSKAATALNRALHVTVFTAGARLGRFDAEAHLAQLVLTGGYTALTPDATTTAALAAQGITLAPLPGTDAGDSGDVIFPLVSGVVERDTLVGRIRHSGGLVFRRGDVAVPIANFNLDVKRVPIMTALSGAGRLPVADLALPDAAPAVNGGRLTVEGVGLALTGTTAAALNEAFSTTVFAAGSPLGTAVIRADIA